MGEVKVQVVLENYVDKALVLDGKMPKSQLRTFTLNALVDTGAVMPMLPQDVVDHLGLKSFKKVVVTYADERKDERFLAGGLFLSIGDRSMSTDCIVGPPLSEALIGQVVLEELDMIVDCQRKTLTVRPESPVYPSLKMK